MKHALQHFPAAGAHLYFATVTGCLDGRLLVRDGSRVTPATRAAGCLLTPECGDTVLVAEGPDDRVFVLSVLERASAEPGRIGLETGFCLDAPRGTIGIQTPEFAVRADSARIEAGSVSLAGKCLNQSFDAVKTVAGAVERTVGRVVERATRVFRRVDECEDMRAGKLRTRIDGTMRVTAGRMTLAADEDVSIDGEKINLG